MTRSCKVRQDLKFSTITDAVASDPTITITESLAHVFQPLKTDLSTNSFSSGIITIASTVTELRATVACTVSKLAAFAAISGEMYMCLIPCVTPTPCAGSGGTVVACADHINGKYGAGRATYHQQKVGRQSAAGDIAPFNVLTMHYPVAVGQVLPHPPLV